MPGIMADNNVVGQFAIILNLLQTANWDDVLKDLGFIEESFEHLGLAPEASDAEVWHVCQQRDILLITANRNRSGPESLEESIRETNRPESIPVITISDPERLVRQRSYAEKVASRLEEYLTNIDRYRGAGRLYVP